MTVDRNNRSHRPKGLPQGYAGTFDAAGPQTAGDDVAPPPAGGRRLDDAMLTAETYIAMDPDVADCAGYAARRLDELIARPAKPGETDDMPLIIENLRYDPQAPGGSHADYVADHIQNAYDGIPVKAYDCAQLEQETRQHILETALDPNRELRKLGLEPVRPDEHTNAYAGPQPEDWVGDYDEETAERRHEAAWKGTQTKQARYAAATEKHLNPLNDDMRDLYKTNVDRGLINGSAFDDRMAFADTLHELQEDGWNPQAGREYRKSKEFRKLEQQLLDGRKPTRRYRQLRDALCDDEHEYRAFMAADPDVFDPDERIVKPFAGLGPDVGQAAMLRLAAKHRGVTGALALARWDPGIEYVTADAKTHTFRMEHDRPGIGYYSDGSTYPIGHTVITANGIKPASVMSWIHNEKPGTPEWEARTRTRFEESNGGEWKPAETDVI